VRSRGMRSNLGRELGGSEIEGDDRHRIKDARGKYSFLDVKSLFASLLYY